MEMDKFLGKRYELYNSENFDEYLKAVGVGWVLRKVAVLTTPTIYLEKDGDFYKFGTDSTFKTTILKFKPDEEFGDEKPDGTVIKTTITFDGNKMIQTQKMEKKSETTREFTENEVIMTATYGDVTTVRKYRVK